MKNSTTAFDKFLSPYKTKENLAKENRNTKPMNLVLLPNYVTLTAMTKVLRSWE